MSEFNLSQERAKRNLEPKTLVLEDDGEVLAKYELKPEFPVSAMDFAVRGHIGDAMRTLFISAEDAQEFLVKHEPTLSDLFDIMLHAYGMKPPGES